MPHIYRIDAAAAGWARRASEIAAAVLARHAGAVDSGARFPHEGIAVLAEQGLLGLCVSADHRGQGQGVRAFAAVVEELALSCASTAMVYVMHVVGQQAIAASPVVAERDAILREIAAGRHLTTLALSEKGSRSQFWAPVSRLSSETGGYVTSAHKSWVTSAAHADSYVSSAQHDGAAAPMETTLYLIRKGMRGVHIAGAFDGLGLRGNESAPVTIDGLHLSASDLISPPGEGTRVTLEIILPWFAVGTAAMANGLCRAAVAATAQHLTSAGFEHTGTRLRDLPNLRARLAEMSVRTEQARALLGFTFDQMEQPSDVTPLYVLQARLASLQAAVDVTDLAMKACGGAAFSRHLPVERLFRDARAGWVMAPTVDHLHDFIGKALTGLPLF